MTIQKQGPTRRTLLGAAAAGAAFGTLPGLIRPAAAADEFKIGLFIALSGPASLFGPTQRACAELAAEEINKAGGILGRQIKLIPTDAGGPPAESTKSAIRLMLEEKVDLFVGSHDSATREALVATIKGKVPYIYTPVYEGGECAFNTYVIADTPEQQIRPSRGMDDEREGREINLYDRRRLRLAAQVQRARQADTSPRTAARSLPRNTSRSARPTSSKKSSRGSNPPNPTRC